MVTSHPGFVHPYSNESYIFLASNQDMMFTSVFIILYWQVLYLNTSVR